MSDPNDPKQPSGNAEFDRLIKLLNMTTSDNDNIALMSIRKANEAIKAKGFDWEGLLRGRVKIVQDPFAAVPQQPAPAPDRQYPVHSGIRRTGAAYQPPPPPYQHQPTPQQASTASAWRPFTNTRRRPNQHPGVCHTCGCRVPDGKGFLAGQKPDGRWNIECDTGWGCKNPKPSRKQRAQQAPSMDDILDNL